MITLKNMTAAANPPAQPFDCRPQAVEKWLENLPRASVGKTAELLYKALQDIHRQDNIKAVDRFRTLEALGDTVHYVILNMRKHFSGLEYPLPSKIMMIASACQSIFDYMAKGYTQAFHDLQKQSLLFVDKKTLTASVYRAITYLHRSLLITYEIYAAYHRNYWQQLHDLYHYAEIHKITTQTVADRYLSIRQKSTIKDEYLRTLLLFRAEPYHLRPGEIIQINEHIEHWYDWTAILNMETEHSPAGKKLLVVDLHGDHPPQYIVKTALNRTQAMCRVIDTTTLLTNLSKQLTQRIADQRSHPGRPATEKTMSIGLLQRLIESWGHTRRRRYPRQQIFEKVNVTIGLHSTHMQLIYEIHVADSSATKNTYSGFKKPKYESIDIKGVGNESVDIWSTVYAWAADNKSNQESTAISDEQDDILTYRVKQDNWTLLNESANGFSLMSVEKQTNKIQVGELLSLQRPGSSVREIGIVRWMKAYSNTGVEMGGMFLAPSAIPVGLISEDRRRGDKIVNRGLLLPLMTTLNQPESIITFSRHFKTNDIIRINQPGQTDFNIKLTKLIADNDTISQFLFVRLEHQLPELNPDESSAEIDLSRYKDVWRNI